MRYRLLALAASAVMSATAAGCAPTATPPSDPTDPPVETIAVDHTQTVEPEQIAQHPGDFGIEFVTSPIHNQPCDPNAATTGEDPGKNAVDNPPGRDGPDAVTTASQAIDAARVPPSQSALEELQQLGSTVNTGASV